MARSISTKAQVWSIDLFIAIVIILLLLAYFAHFTYRVSNPSQQQIKEIQQDAGSISEFLVSSGYPENWNNETVIYIGLADNKRLIPEKLKEFSAIDYKQAQDLLSIKSDFLIFFEEKDSSSLEIDGITAVGKPGVTKQNIDQIENPPNLVKITRFLIYESRIVMMVIYVW